MPRPPRGSQQIPGKRGPAGEKERTPEEQAGAPARGGSSSVLLPDGQTDSATAGRRKAWPLRRLLVLPALCSGGPAAAASSQAAARLQPHAAASSALPPAAVLRDRPWPRGGQHSQRPGLPWGHRASHPPCDRPSRAAGSVPETSLLPSEGSEGLERLVGAGPGACRGTVLAGPGCPRHRESRAGTPSPP